MQPINIIHIASSHLSFESLKAVISLQESQTRWQRQKLIDLIQQCNVPPKTSPRTWSVKDQVLGDVFGGTFSDYFRQNLSPHPHCQENLAINFLLDLGFSAFLLILFTDPVPWNLCKLVTSLEGDPKAPFSIATTLRCRKGRYSIFRIVPFYPRSSTYSAEC